MRIKVCAQCGAEIGAEGIAFREKLFCSDACCDEFEEELAAAGDDVIEIELDDDEDDLGYRADVEEDEDILSDEYRISPDDF